MTIATTTTDRFKETLRGLAAYGLDGTGHSLPSEPFDDNAFQHLLRWVQASKLIGLTGAAVANDALVVTPSQRDAVADKHLKAMCHTLYLERLLLDLTDGLDRAGIECRVLKGSAVAQLDYEDPFLRPFVDIDILVQSDSFDAAVDVIQRAGVNRIWHGPRPGFDRRFGKGATLSTPDGYEVDLHRTFVQGPWGLTVDLGDLWKGSRTIELGGKKLLALSDEARLLHAAIHATLGHTASTPFLPSRDIAEMLLFGAVNASAARELAARWQMEAVLAEAVTGAWHLLDLADVTTLSAWAEGYHPSELDERRRSVYRAGGATYTAKSLAALSTLPRFRDKLSMASSLAFPSRQFLEDRNLRYRDWLRRGVGSAVRARRGS